MRIAMVTETYPPEVNGVARTIALTVDALRVRGHSIQLVRPRQNGHDVVGDAPGFETLLRPGFPIPRYTQLQMGLPSRRALERAWSEQRPEVVHIATEGPLGWSALSAAHRLRLPVATDFRTNFHTYMRNYGVPWLARPVTSYLRSFHNRAACTMVPTREMAEALAAQGFERLRVVARGVDTKVFHPQRRSRELRASWGAGDDTPVVLCVSRFAREKNFALVIEAYQAMRRICAEAKLVFVGDGPLAEELRRKNVGFVVAGRKADAELARHYASGNVFLFASMSETWGNVTLEAMASGLAIIAYDYAAARETLRHGESALLAPFGDAKAFVAQAERLARDPELVRALGRAVRAAAEALAWGRIVAEFEAVLHDVAS